VSFEVIRMVKVKIIFFHDVVSASVIEICGRFWGWGEGTVSVLILLP